MLKDNVSVLRETIESVCASCGRKSDEITVVAATKTVPASVIAQLPALGITLAGENRVQEFVAKADGVQGVDWHIIGALQTNKVKYVVGKVALIQSVDSLKLAQEIAKRSLAKNITSEILLEVNIGNEPNKSGISVEDLWPLADEIAQLRGLRLRGLMAVPPIGAPVQMYETMRSLSDALQTRQKQATILSMGMSADYATAIRCGSTMIRPGSALFGPRGLPQKA